MSVVAEIKPKNFRMANKGMLFEEEIRKANEGYRNREIALVQKISTPWKVIRNGKRIVSAFPEGKSTLDFRGTVKGGISISFDTKETEEENGLPLKNIEPHQIDYIRDELKIMELSFILCYIKAIDKRYRIAGQTVLDYWDYWQANKGKRGANYIPTADMTEISSKSGIVLHYLEGLVG